MIREMVLSDIEEIAEIEKKCFNDAWSSESIRNDFLNNDLSVYYVDARDGKIAGYIFFWITFDSATVVNIAVEESYRRKGIAQDLLNRCVEKCEEEGCEYLTLEVRVSNSAAIAFYEKNGFMKVNVKKGYYTDNYEDALYMVKPLMVRL